MNILCLRLVFIILLTASFDSLQAQVVKYKATHLATTSVKDGKIQTPYQKEKDISALIVFNFTKDIAEIYSPHVQRFDIVDYMDKDSSDTCITYGFKAVDNDGDKCTLLLLVFSGKKYYDQLFVHYGSYVFVYNIQKQEDQ